MSDRGFSIVGRASIGRARLITLKYAIQLEGKGMRRSGRGRSSLKIAKDLGYSGSREKVLAQIEADIKKGKGY